MNLFSTEGSGKPIVIMPSSITLDENYLEGDIGFVYYLKANILPENATNKNIIWTTSNNLVATVDSNGKVEIVGDGVCTITATTVNNLAATCAIKHYAEILPTSVIIAGDSNVDKGATIQLSAEVLPENATNKSVTWHTSDPSIATVNSGGLVTGIKGGACVITARTANGVVGTHDINVVVAPSDIELNLDDITFYIDDSESLYYIIPLDINNNGGKGTADKPFKISKQYDCVAVGIESDEVNLKLSMQVKVISSNSSVTFTQYTPDDSEYNASTKLANLQEYGNDGYCVKLSVETFITDIDFSVTYTMKDDPTAFKVVYYTTKVA